MFVCHLAKLHPDSWHSEGLGTRICRPQPGPSFQLPEILSVPEEAVYRRDVPSLLNVNHKGVQFFAPFPKFTMTITTISEGILEDFRTYTPTTYWLLDSYGYNP